MKPTITNYTKRGRGNWLATDFNRLKKNTVILSVFLPSFLLLESFDKKRDMTLEFQKETLQFLTQTSSAKKYILHLQPDYFTLDVQHTVFSLLKSFVTSYRTLPTNASLKEHFRRELSSKKTAINQEVIDMVDEGIDDAFKPFKGSADFMREVIMERYQIALTKKLFAEKATSLGNNEPDILPEIFREIQKIKSLSQDDEAEADNKGRFALDQFEKGQRTQIEATPIFLKGVNKMTSTRGFYSPQLIIIMAAPKGFKSGTALNIAVNLVRDGERVYYVDCENGQDRILDRFYQCMLNATWEEYASGELDDTLQEQVERFKALGGDFIADFYPAHTKSMADVEDRLKELEEEHGWTPTVIIYDYLDLMKPEDYRIKEKRLMIQAVYFDAIRLQKRRKIWGVSPSQVNKEAVGKAVIDMKGFSEDFGKAANAHGAFALCRTDDEVEAKVARLVPVIQRDGVRQTKSAACFLYIDEGSMTIKEIDKKEWEQRVTEATAALRTKTPDKKKQVKNPRGIKTVTDE